jgi:hypothetical protein
LAFHESSGKDLNATRFFNARVAGTWLRMTTLREKIGGAYPVALP